MKFQFEPNLDFQKAAWEAVCDLFEGQEINRTEFTVTNAALGGQYTLGFTADGLGYGNRLTLLDDEIRANLNQIQIRNGLPPSPALASGDFTVEMETGTGKTYVYLRTIFELNERYGFTKFVIVVPSVAIREGVYKTLQMTEDHIKGLYAGTPYEYFVYDSSKLGQVRNFATSSKIQIMVVTVGAINKKDVNNLYKDSEKMGGERPIDLIQSTHPILIVDEPQSVDGGLKGAGKKALERMNPLSTLRYSATHVHTHHMVYRLDAVDAYERKLVKQIEVASATVENAYNKPYVKVASTRTYYGDVVATVELDVLSKGKVHRKHVKVQHGDDLEQTTGRAIYRDHRVGEIRTGDEAWMELQVPGHTHYLNPGEGVGNLDEDALVREMIRRTIKEHLDKEKRLRPQGIKVLSLFFVPRVNLYRIYDEDGRPQKGLYAQIFEEEYRRFMTHPDYRTLFQEVEIETAPEEVHDGYFSIDKNQRFSEPDLTKSGGLRNQRSRNDAERAYNLIMKDKERLLSFDTPLKFIFSHSALREGWDNPNVFQICSLRDIRTERERRQTIGRGLRICVNQDGERVRGFDVNTLTVIAREGYKEFANNLQKEIEQDTGIRFGVVDRHEFASIVVGHEDGEADPFGTEASEVLWKHFAELGYVDKKGRVQDILRVALNEGTVDIPEEHEEQREQIEGILRKLAASLDIKNADERTTIKTRRAVLHSNEFKALWDRIKHKTTYRVDFDPEDLISNCIEKLQQAPPIPKSRIQWRKADVEIGKSGVEAVEKEGAASVVLQESDIKLPDVLTELQDQTQLTRKSIQRILSGSGRLRDFRRNPQKFVKLASEVINRVKREALVDGIKYVPIGDGRYYAQELFEEQELTGYLKNMLEDTEKSVHEHVVYDFGVEKNFAQQLEKHDAVKVYAKLPNWFTVPTPLGTYNPDWAVMLDGEDRDRLYLVVETKSSLFEDDRRDKENLKIKCGKARFRDVKVSEPQAQYITATGLSDVFDHSDQ